MKKRLILMGTLLMAGTVTTSLLMKESTDAKDLLAANVEALSWGETAPGNPCGVGNVPDAILDKDDEITSETITCTQSGSLSFARGVLYDSRYRRGQTYTISYETSSCHALPYSGSCCNPSGSGYHITNDGLGY